MDQHAGRHVNVTCEDAPEQGGHGHQSNDQVLAHIVRVLGPGATFNDVAVFDGGSDSDGAIADGAGVIGLLPRAEMSALFEPHPETAAPARKLFSARQRALGAAVENPALRDVTMRVARLILGCVKQHDHVIEHSPDACSRITHQNFASMVRSVREVAQIERRQVLSEGARTIVAPMQLN